MDVLRELEKVNAEIAEHKWFWRGEMGTCFERADWKRKQRRKKELLAQLVALPVA